MPSVHKVLRVQGGRLVNDEPRRALEEQLDQLSLQGYELAESFAVDDNIYLVVRRAG